MRVGDFKEEEHACVILSLTVDHSDNAGFCGWTLLVSRHHCDVDGVVSKGFQPVKMLRESIMSKCVCVHRHPGPLFAAFHYIRVEIGLWGCPGTGDRGGTQGETVDALS